MSVHTENAAESVMLISDFKRRAHEAFHGGDKGAATFEQNQGLLIGMMAMLHELAQMRAAMETLAGSLTAEFDEDEEDDEDDA
jgi:hypothetical protein